MSDVLLFIADCGWLALVSKEDLLTTQIVNGDAIRRGDEFRAVPGRSELP